MTTAGGGADVEVDVAALRRAAALLGDAVPALERATGAASRAQHDVAGPVAGAPVLGVALAELARRFDEAVGPVGRRVSGSATMLRATVDAFVTADEAGARDISGPR